MHRSTNTKALEIEKGRLEGVYIIHLSPLVDERGFFMRAYDTSIMRKAGLEREWVQENHSRNERQGILRGLHFQHPPHAETKLVRCTRGEIFDVFVDLRKGSATFGQWEGVHLSEENKRMVFIPRGFAHGYYTLSPVSEVLYKVDSPYHRESEDGLLWSDPELGIDWPFEQPPILSGKDRQHQTLRQFVAKHKGLENATSD